MTGPGAGGVARVGAGVLLAVLLTVPWGHGVQGQAPGPATASAPPSRTVRVSAGIAYPAAGEYEYWSAGPSFVVSITPLLRSGSRFGLVIAHTRFLFDRGAYLDENAGWLQVSPETADVSSPARSLTSVGGLWTRTLSDEGRVGVVGMWGGTADFLSGPTIRVEGLERTSYSGLPSLGVLAGLAVGVRVGHGASLTLETTLHQGVWLSGTILSVRFGLTLPGGGSEG